MQICSILQSNSDLPINEEFKTRNKCHENYLFGLWFSHFKLGANGPFCEG